MLNNKILAEVFTSLVTELADHRHIRLLFPRQNEEGAIKRALRKANIEYEKEGDWFLTDVGTRDATILKQILEAISFTEFYAQIDGHGPLPKKVSGLLDALENHYFVCLFSLYDESMEIFSKFLKEEEVLEAARQMGREKGFQVELGSREKN